MSRGIIFEVFVVAVVICSPVLVALQVKHHHHHHHHQRAGGGAARRPQSAGSGQQRRRYQRVVRNENAPPPDQPDDNPYVIRKFTQVTKPASLTVVCLHFDFKLDLCYVVSFVSK